MARQKTVFTPSQLAHVWAAQSPDFPAGRVSRNSFFFTGPRIYSYGEHFIIAAFTDAVDADGRRVILQSGNTYGPTTGRHCSHVAGALRDHRGARVFQTAPDVYLTTESGRGSGNVQLPRDVAGEPIGPAVFLQIAQGWAEHARDTYAQALRRRDAGNAAYDLRVVESARETIADLAGVVAATFRNCWRVTYRKAFADVAAGLPAAIPGAWNTITDNSYGRPYTRHVAAPDLRDKLAALRDEAKAEAKRARARGGIASAVKESRDVNRDARAPGADPGTIARRLESVAGRVTVAEKEAKRAGVDLPARWPSAANMRKRAAALHLPALRADLDRAVSRLVDGARNGTRAYAAGQRVRKAWKRGRVADIKARELSPDLRARMIAAPCPAVMTEWERLGAVDLGAAWEAVDRTAAALEKAGNKADKAAAVAGRDAALRAYRVLGDMKTRVVAAKAYANAAEYLQDAQEHAAALSRLLALPPVDLYALQLEIVAGNDGGGTAWARVHAGAPAMRRDAFDRAANNARAAMTRRLETTAPRLAADVNALPRITDNPAFSGIVAASAVAATGRAAGSLAVAVDTLAAIRARMANGKAGRPQTVAGELSANSRTIENAAREAGKTYGADMVPADVAALFADALQAARAAEAETVAALDAYRAEWKEPTRETWRAGGPLWDGAYRDPVALRVAGDTVETSHGAEVSRLAASQLRRLVLQVRRSGAPLSFGYGAGPRVGPFALETVSTRGDVKIGCHTIRYEELAHVAAVFGWPMDATAADVVDNGAAV